MNNLSPLADRVRPREFDEIVGQSHLFGDKGFLRKMVEHDVVPSMIFFGPPGCGKSTAATIIAEKSNKTLYKLNATTASLSDVREVLKDTGSIMGQGGILLYLDEIQYFNKKQQQSLLEYLEDGRITLIASTTENPYYYIYDALLSRCSVFEFKHVANKDIEKRLRSVAGKEYPDVAISDASFETMARMSGGDVRRGLNNLEIAVSSADRIDGVVTVCDDDIIAMYPSNAQSNFDRDGDVHYDLVAALQKSIRGSDPDAAIFYLARILEGGDLISACRRLLVTACEDIGAAYPMAPAIVKACCDAARETGMPEARIPLANAVIILATAPKSNSAECAIDAALEDIHAGRGTEIPTHLRSPLFKGYKYPHIYPGHYVKQQYLPDDLKDRHYYTYGENKSEQAAKAYFEKITNNNKE